MALSDFTPNLGLPYLLSNQAQKHVTLNESLRALDGLMQLSVLARDMLSPPTDPGEGDRYLIGEGAGGDWTGQGGKIGYFADGGWLYFTPQTGWRVWSEEESLLLVFDGESWVSVTPDALQNLRLLGLGATADEQNPLLAKLNAALFTAMELADGGNGDLRYKLNKEASGNVLSLLLQTGYSSRAEIGLVGDDDLALKVSPDGASFYEGMRIDRNSGLVSFPSGVSGLRPLIAAALTLYVDAVNGSDSYDGLTPLTAFATLSRAASLAAASDLGIHSVTIRLADGNYAETVSFSNKIMGGSKIRIEGNIASPGSVSLQGLYFEVPGQFELGGVTLAGASYGLSAQNGASVTVTDKIHMGVCGIAHFRASVSGVISIAAAYDITGGAGLHIFCQDFAKLTCNGVSVTLTSVFAFNAFLRASQLCYVRYSPNLSGTATGKRYNLDTGAIVNTNGGGAGFLPGDVAGTASNGAQYI